MEYVIIHTAVYIYMSSSKLMFTKRYLYHFCVVVYYFYFVQVFFFKAQLRDGSLTPSSGVSDHAWLTYDELPKYTRSAYYKHINKFLLEV